MRISDWSSDVCSSDLKLALDPAHPTRYRVGDDWHRLSREHVTIMVKGPDGRTSPVSHDFWNSIYGPVLSRADGLAWDGTTAYAIRDANLDNNQMVEAWHAMARAGSLGAAETAIRGKLRSAEHTSELQSLMRIPYSLFFLKKKK